MKKLIIYKFFKEFINYKKNSNRAVVFMSKSFYVSQLFLNIATTDDTLQKSGNEESFRHKLKYSPKTYESLGPQSFTTTTGTREKKSEIPE